MYILLIIAVAMGQGMAVSVASVEYSSEATCNAAAELARRDTRRLLSVSITCSPK